MANGRATVDGGTRVTPVSVDPMFRRAILATARHPVIVAAVRRHGMRFGADRFVAGETFDECVAVLRGLNNQGFRTNTTLLGEGVRHETTMGRVVEAYKEILDRIASEELITNVALKPTHLGLAMSEEMAHRNVSLLLVHAGVRDNFLRLDMEESARVDGTLRLFRRLRADGHENLGTVLQSALYRSEDDLRALSKLRPNLRLVKGAYLEPPSVAHSKKADVDRAYLRLAERMLGEIPFTAFATHDKRIIDWVSERAERLKLGSEHYEFQMLYGVRTDLQHDLVRGGRRVLVATPYGPDWYFYLMRRLAERPANLLFVGRSLFSR